MKCAKIKNFMQFEIKNTDGNLKILRAKNLEDALHRYELSDFTLGEADEFLDWIPVFQAEELVAHIRPFNRMKFRRD
jgi:hypothetical protein